MSRKRKKSKAVPVVLLITLLAAALAAGCLASIQELEQGYGKG